MEMCNHDIIGVEPNKGWYECKKCGQKLRGEEAKALLEQDYSGLSQGVTDIGTITVNKDGDSTTVIHRNLPDGPETVKPKKEKPTYEKVTLSSGHVVESKTVTIACVDCGTERIVKIQDQFQVKRCIPCQKKHRNHQRYLNRKAGNKKKAEGEE